MENEILIETSEGYTVLREKDYNGSYKTYVVVPLEDFKPKTETKNKKKKQDAVDTSEKIQETEIHSGESAD